MLFFFFNATATTKIYTLSLTTLFRSNKEHNIRLREMALAKDLSLSDHCFKNIIDGSEIYCTTEEEVYKTLGLKRSEEHTSELQSLAYLVCRLLLEKKKKIKEMTVLAR